MNKDKYKIALFSHHPSHISGFAKVTRYIFKALKDAGYQVKCIDNMAFSGKVSDKDILENTFTKGAEYATRSRELTEKVLSEWKPNIVISIGDPWDAYHLATFKSSYSFYWMSYTPIETYPIERFVRVEVIYRLSKNMFDYLKYYERVDKIIAYNSFGKNAIKELLEDHKINPQNKLIDIPHGFDSNIYNYNVNATKEEIFNVNKDTFVAITIARNNTRKGLDSLLIAWKKFIKHTKADAVLYLHVPDEAGGWKLARLVSVTGNSKTVLINDKITSAKGLSESKLANLIASSNVYINSSIGEGFGLPIIEALGCGIPAIVPDYAGPKTIKESICNNKIIDSIQISEFKINTASMSMEGIISTDELAKQITYCYTEFKAHDTLPRKTIANAAKEIYDWKLIGNQWVNVIENIDSSILFNSRFTFTRI